MYGIRNTATMAGAHGLEIFDSPCVMHWKSTLIDVLAMMVARALKGHELDPSPH